MESVDLDMADVFGDGDDERDDNFPSALPDLPAALEPLDNGGDDIPPTQDAENAEVLAKLKGMKGAGKKVVRHPQPKLDATRLTGERGIAILPKVFKDVKFKGRGHEAEDLRITMKYLEHWAHRLFPMMPFDEVIERIEKLGTKKEVQTCIKKMRMDIPILKEDFVAEEEENLPSPARGNQADFDAEEAFDEIIREEQEQRAQSQQPAPLASLLDTPARTPVANLSTPASTPGRGVTPGLTPEQRERMERNKRLAMEKRAARLAKHSSDTAVNSFVPEQERNRSSSPVSVENSELTTTTEKQLSAKESTSENGNIGNTSSTDLSQNESQEDQKEQIINNSSKNNLHENSVSSNANSVPVNITASNEDVQMDTNDDHEKNEQNTNDTFSVNRRNDDESSGEKMDTDITPSVNEETISSKDESNDAQNSQRENVEMTTEEC